MRRQYQIALRNHSFVRFASALDAILQAFTFSRPQADDFIAPGCCRSRYRRDEIDGLSDLELVRQVRHRKASLEEKSIAPFAALR